MDWTMDWIMELIMDWIMDSTAITYLLMHCLGLKPTMYAEKMHRNLIFGTRLEAIKNWTVGSPEKFQNTRSSPKSSP